MTTGLIRIDNFIGGKFRPPAQGNYLKNVEPATGKVYGEIPDSGAEDVDAAIATASDAFQGWKKSTAQTRSTVMLRMAQLVEDRLEKFARAESVDTGKPISLAESVDIPRAVANLRFFATAILHTNTEAHITDHQAINYTLRRPLGVVGLISPWNLPLYLLTWKIAPAIASGNTAVAKPSEITPMTAFLLAQVCDDAGLPPGVLNIVHGTGPGAGAPLVAHEEVRAISFTGGTATGAAIAKATAGSFKKLALEMGGKNPNLIFADADLDTVVETTVRSSFSNQGQICLCGSRIVVERSIHNEFVKRFVTATNGLKVGDPLCDDTDHGALVSEQHLAKVKSYVDLAIAEGGNIECGGDAPSGLSERCTGGFFLNPTAITGLGPDCRVNQEEIFGPVVTIIPFDTEEEAITIANGTRYGLSASVWTSDLARSHRVAEALEAGTVWINCWMLRDLRVPFGGMKDSGVGREGGNEALRFFTEPKNVCTYTGD